MCGRIFGTILATVWAVAVAAGLIFGAMLPILSRMESVDGETGLIAYAITMAAWLVFGAAPACRIVQAFMPDEYHWWRGPERSYPLSSKEKGRH